MPSEPACDSARPPPSELRSLAERLRGLGGSATCIVEPGVGHSFMNEAWPDRFDARAAAAGWDRASAFLRAELA